MSIDTLYYVLALLVVGVVVLAFYNTIQSFRIKKRELDIREMKLRQRMK
ncbi:hypothetical protein [Paenibacillus wulumuqiensis]|nr:hypothetical protein [Paenibacillus wulumuqiensis]